MRPFPFTLPFSGLEQSAIRWRHLIAFVLRQKQDSRVIRDLGLIANDSKSLKEKTELKTTHPIE